MEKKKTAENIILIAFMVLICALSLIWLPLQKILDNENYENRELAERPDLTLENYGIFSGEFEAYFNDHIPFRNYFMTINNAIDVFIFRHSQIPGKAGAYMMMYEPGDLPRIRYP